MNKKDVTKFFVKVRKGLSKNAPALLTGMGIAGMYVAVGQAVVATPKAVRLIERRKEEEWVDELTPVETVKTVWKCYIPTAITCAVSTACLIGANSVHGKRHAALMTAYKLSETAFSDYKEQVVETLGEKKEKTISEKVAKKQVEKNPPSDNEVIPTKAGNTLCMDSVSHRYFHSDIDFIHRAMTDLNRDIVTDIGMKASLNDFYDKIGLAPSDVGDYLGWNIDDGKLEVVPVPHLMEDNTVVVHISYNVAPHYNF